MNVPVEERLESEELPPPLPPPIPSAARPRERGQPTACSTLPALGHLTEAVSISTMLFAGGIGGGLGAAVGYALASCVRAAFWEGNSTVRRDEAGTAIVAGGLGMLVVACLICICSAIPWDQVRLDEKKPFGEYPLYKLGLLLIGILWVGRWWIRLSERVAARAPWMAETPDLLLTGYATLIGILCGVMRVRIAHKKKCRTVTQHAKRAS